MTITCSKYSKSRASRIIHFPKWYVVLKVLIENEGFYFSKRVLRADTPRKKWLKKALDRKLTCLEF